MEQSTQEILMYNRPFTLVGTIMKYDKFILDNKS